MPGSLFRLAILGQTALWRDAQLTSIALERAVIRELQLESLYVYPLRILKKAWKSSNHLPEASRTAQRPLRSWQMLHAEVPKLNVNWDYLAAKIPLCSPNSTALCPQRNLLTTQILRPVFRR